VRSQLEDEIVEEVIEMFDRMAILRYENKLSEVSFIKYRYLQKMLLKSSNVVDMEVAIEELRIFDQELSGDQDVSVEEKKQQIVDLIRENGIRLMDLDSSLIVRIGIIKSQLENVNHLKQLLDFENEIMGMLPNTRDFSRQIPSSSVGNSSITTVKPSSSKLMGDNSWMKGKTTSNDHTKTNQEAVEEKTKFFISVYFIFIYA